MTVSLYKKRQLSSSWLSSKQCKSLGHKHLHKTPNLARRELYCHLFSKSLSGLLIDPSPEYLYTVLSDTSKSYLAQAQRVIYSAPLIRNDKSHLTGRRVTDSQSRMVPQGDCKSTRCTVQYGLRQLGLHLTGVSRVRAAESDRFLVTNQNNWIGWNLFQLSSLFLSGKSSVCNHCMPVL
jgi:hypothetical protein